MAHSPLVPTPDRIVTTNRHPDRIVTTNRHPDRIVTTNRHPDRIVTTNRRPGFVPVMLLPFTTDGRIDYAGLDALVDFYLDNGATGLFANCLSSEMYELTPAERLAHVDHIVRRVNGAVPVVATGTFGGSTDGQARFVRQMHDLGVDSVIIITSLFAAPDEPDAVLLNCIGELLDQTGTVPMGLYECPVPYKRLLTPAGLEQLVATGRITYHKDTSCDPAAIADKLAAVPPGTIGFYDAHVPNAVSSLRAGASGLSAIAGNYFPEILTWLCRHVNDPDERDTVDWLQLELTRTNALLHDRYPLSAKHFLAGRGLPVAPVCRRVVPALSDGQHAALRDLHHTLAGWHERLGLAQSVSVPG